MTRRAWQRRSRVLTSVTSPAWWTFVKRLNLLRRVSRWHAEQMTGARAAAFASRSHSYIVGPSGRRPQLYRWTKPPPGTSGRWSGLRHDKRKAAEENAARCERRRGWTCRVNRPCVGRPNDFR